MKIVNTWTFPLIGLLAASSMLSQASLQAKEVSGLFEISVPVENKANSTRQLATHKALSEIMIRISGLSTAATNAVIESSLNKSSAYIQRYSYHENDLVDSDGKPDKQLILDLFFDEMSLRNLLRDADLPRWGSNRPQVLLWVAIGDPKQRFLLGTDDELMLKSLGLAAQTEDQPNIKLESTEIPSLHIDIKAIVNQQAEKRGLPILLPLMDLEDSISISVADVWGRFVEPIRQASLRYDSDAILAAQLLKSTDGWISRWLLLHKGRTLSWEQESDSIEAALIAGVDSTTDQLAEQYAVFEDSLQRNELLISVSNIEHLEDYAHLMKYLQELTSVHSVNVAGLSNSAIQLRLNLIGEQQAMLQAISLNNRLVRESMPAFNQGNTIVTLPSLFFRWNPES